jgi:hypothetical protein
MLPEGVSSALQAKQTALASQVQAGCMRKVLDSMELQGQAVNQLLQDAAQRSKDPGMGQKFDATA